MAPRLPLTQGYGETPLPHEEPTALLADVVDLIDEPINICRLSRPVNSDEGPDLAVVRFARL
jgi:hypothetical protein